MSAPATGQMQWVSVQDRVPTDRRKVLAWGMTYIAGSLTKRDGFLGVTRYNPAPRDGCFDIEGGHSWITRHRVTHWCDIKAPQGSCGGDA